jgi:hypothetical protein
MQMNNVVKQNAKMLLKAMEKLWLRDENQTEIVSLDDYS